MFCKSGILIFIFAENNYSIYAQTMLTKTPLLNQSFGPCVFLSFSLSLSLSLSLSFWLISWNAKAVCVTQEILASLLLSLSHHRLRTTRFRSIKGHQHMWNLPGPGIKPLSSALAGGFLCTRPPGKSQAGFLS